MNRFEFRKRFKTAGPAVLPVIHARDRAQVVRNAQIAVREGAHGVFLINHDFAPEGLLPLVREVRARYPSLWLGVNFLGVTGARAFPVLGELERSGCVVDAYWADDARIDERSDVQREADAIAEARRASGWSGLYLGGTAFKKQREVRPEHFETAARIATGYMDAVTTSGVATGALGRLGENRGVSHRVRGSGARHRLRRHPGQRRRVRRYRGCHPRRHRHQSPGRLLRYRADAAAAAPRRVPQGRCGASPSRPPLPAGTCRSWRPTSRETGSPGWTRRPSTSARARSMRWSTI